MGVYHWTVCVFCFMCGFVLTSAFVYKIAHIRPRIALMMLIMVFLNNRFLAMHCPFYTDNC